MISIGLNLLTQVAKNAIVGTITTKVIDSIIVSKINKKNDQLKWVRETKLSFFSKLSEQILSYDLLTSNASDEKKVKEYSTKTMLLLDDKRLINKIESYINELNKAQRTLIYKENYSEELVSNFNQKGIDLVMSLNNNLKRS